MSEDTEILRAIIERKMSLHWDMAACQCWFCVAGRDAGCYPRGEYLPHKVERGTYVGDTDCPSEYQQAASAAIAKEKSE